MAINRFVSLAFCGFVKLLTGVRAVWRSNLSEEKQRVYFANHRSHCDFVLVWACLPPVMRYKTRPVAAADYWLGGRLKRYIISQVFRGVLINRVSQPNQPNPVDCMQEALRADSLIIFPEGTRNLEDELLPFKSGIYHLARSSPHVEFVPVWIENLGRVMPKGAVLPVPLLCSLTFGQPIQLEPEETKDTFLARARQALLQLGDSQ